MIYGFGMFGPTYRPLETKIEISSLQLDHAILQNEFTLHKYKSGFDDPNDLKLQKRNFFFEIIIIKTWFTVFDVQHGT